MSFLSVLPGLSNTSVDGGRRDDGRADDVGSLALSQIRETIAVIIDLP